MSQSTPQTVHLVYSSDQEPGLTRRAQGESFLYFDLQGEQITDLGLRARYDALAIPPAYQEVWICPHENGHIQATGRDERGRKQYLYHPHWTELQKQLKFEKLERVGRGLPRLRRQIRRALAKGVPQKEAVVATALRLIDKLGFRVGSEAYLKENATRGITTLAKKNVELTEESSEIKLSYRGKGGAEIETSFHDPYLKELIEDCHELPGQRLFQYKTAGGKRVSVQSSDLNTFLSESYTEPITSKDLRTWRSSVLLLETLRRHDRVEDHEACYREALKESSAQLNHTVAVCQEHYVHPLIEARFMASGTEGFSQLIPPEGAELQFSERLLLHLLEEPFGQ